MIRRPPRSTPFPTRRSSDLLSGHSGQAVAGHAARARLAGSPGEPPRDDGRSAPRGTLRPDVGRRARSEEHTSELQSPCNLVCRLLLEKKKKTYQQSSMTNDD